MLATSPIPVAAAGPGAGPAVDQGAGPQPVMQAMEAMAAGTGHQAAAGLGAGHQRVMQAMICMITEADC
jgi:hypothetical protein